MAWGQTSLPLAGAAVYQRENVAVNAMMHSMPDCPSALHPL